MNTVSFETAKALRDAGFPQPFPGFGQFWYDAGAGVWVVGESGLLVFRSLSSRAEIEIAGMDMGGVIFAPQAHDILAQVPGCDIGYYPENSDGWVSFYDYGETTNEDKNPHELAAKLFLLNKAVEE